MLRLVIGQGLAVVAIGLGLLASRLLVRFIEGPPYGVTPTNLITSAVVCGLLGGVAIVALAVPARRATRVDPVRVLREK